MPLEIPIYFILFTILQYLPTNHNPQADSNMKSAQNFAYIFIAVTLYSSQTLPSLFREMISFSISMKNDP